MRLRSPLLALLGLFALGVVAVRLLDGRLSVAQGAMRILVVLAVLLAVERLLLPIARAMVGGPKPPEPAEPAPGAPPAPPAA